MNNDRVYLRPNALIEPLVNQWYAWPYLIPPATAAMYVANHHTKVMQSFVTAPQIHAQALKNPAMVGGPFLNHGVDRAGDVKALLDKTLKERAPQLELAAAIKALDNLLSTAALGESLEPLYPKVPEPLRGYVELVYDLNNHPSVRYIEPLLYRSRHYDRSTQSLALSLTQGDGRSFVFSTPRLSEPHVLPLPLPFDHPGVDALARMTWEPGSRAAVAELLGVPKVSETLFASFFTEEAPPPPPRYTGPDVRVRYFGHACILVETDAVTLLCDPVVSPKYPAEVPRYTTLDLPETIDYVLLTHNHQDHCMFETLLRLRHRIRTIVVPKSAGGTLADPSLKLILRTIGFKNVVEIDELDPMAVPGGSITALPFLGEHADLDVRTKAGFLIELKGRTIVAAADSNNIEPRLYDHLRALVPSIDLLFIGMECVGGPLTWLYGPLLTKPLPRKMDQSRRLDGSDHQRARGVVERLDPAHVYVYAMGQEPWLSFLTSLHYEPGSKQIVDSDRLVADCRAQGRQAERLFGHKEIVLEARSHSVLAA